MSNNLLKPVFRSIFDYEFDQKKFEERLKMQKIVYLLQNMGISVGNYNFLWYKHGPYSQTLQNDILNLKEGDSIDINFSSDAKKEINALKEAINKETLKYNQCEWAECLGSLLYIKDNLLPYSASEKDILNELVQRKPHLNINEDNQMALRTLEELFI